jgi:hypothetical protein
MILLAGLMTRAHTQPVCDTNLMQVGAPDLERRAMHAFDVKDHTGYSTFVVTTSTACAEALTYGVCGGTPEDGKVCTDVGNYGHSQWIQEFFVADALQFTIEWNFQGSKTLKQRMQHAVDHGELVEWTVTPAPGLSFGGVTAENPATMSAIWRYSDGCGDLCLKFDCADGSSFCQDDGIWGAAVYQNSSSEMNGNSGIGLHNGYGWGHANQNTGDGDCANWYANGTQSSSTSIRNLMWVADGGDGCSAGGACGSASVFGDPHMKNVRGEKFEVRKAGVHTLINVPQGSDADDALLRADALVESQARNASKCSGMFVTRLNIAGRWLGMTPTLTFSAGAGPAGHADGAGLKVGNSSSLTIEEFESRVPLKMAKLTLPASAVVKPTLANRHATTMTASLVLGPGVHLKVSWVLERTPDQTLANSLWVSATGLSSVRDQVGGLLGFDDHRSASTKDPACVGSGGQLM